MEAKDVQNDKSVSSAQNARQVQALQEEASTKLGSSFGELFRELLKSGTVKGIADGILSFDQPDIVLDVDVKPIERAALTNEVKEEGRTEQDAQDLDKQEVKKADTKEEDDEEVGFEESDAVLEEVIAEMDYQQDEVAEVVEEQEVIQIAVKEKTEVELEQVSREIEHDTLEWDVKGSSEFAKNYQRNQEEIVQEIGADVEQFKASDVKLSSEDLARSRAVNASEDAGEEVKVLDDAFKDDSTSEIPLWYADFDDKGGTARQAAARHSSQGSDSQAGDFKNLLAGQGQSGQEEKVVKHTNTGSEGVVKVESARSGEGKKGAEQLAGRETPQTKMPSQTQTKLIERIQQVLETASKNRDNSTIVVRLDPPQLGVLTVKLMHRGDELHGRIIPENPEVEAVLKARINEVNNILTSSGIKADNIHVSVGQENQNSNSLFNEFLNAGGGQEGRERREENSSGGMGEVTIKDEPIYRRGGVVDEAAWVA